MIRTRAEHDATAMASAEERLPSDSRDHCVQTHVVADSCVESSPSPQKKRLRQRDQIVALRKEISALNQQLQELNDGQLLQDTLDRLLDGSGVRTNWKQVAKRERRAVELAMETKTELKRQAAANLYLLKHVKRMFLAQRKSVLLSRMSTRCISFQPEREDSQVFLGLKARLDRRTSQLDEVLAQCVASVATCERRKFCALDDGQRMELRTIEVKPFAFMAVGETIYQQRQKDVQFKSLGENEVVLFSLSLLRGHSSELTTFPLVSVCCSILCGMPEASCIATTSRMRCAAEAPCDGLCSTSRSFCSGKWFRSGTITSSRTSPSRSHGCPNRAGWSSAR